MILSIDLQAEYLADKAEIDAAVSRVLAGGRYILGPEVEGFEQEFAGYIGCRHAVGVASGTDALVLALKAVGVREGDLVATVSHTAVATVAAIELTGAQPVFVDVDDRRFTMCPQSLQRVLTLCHQLHLSVKAVVPVHLYGQPCDLTAIQAIAHEFELKVVEDCSQSHGGSLLGRMTGTFGDVAAFSLYPTKNLGALGDAGVVTTNSAEVAERIRLLRQYGWKTRNLSEIPGMNSRLDELQAAILRVRLRKLAERTTRRQQIADRYDQLLAGHCQAPLRIEGTQHVFHQYVIRSADRDGVQRRMLEKGVSTLIHYPTPVHQQPAYQNRLVLKEDGVLANTERIVPEILSLPMFPQLTDEHVLRVAEVFRDSVR